MRPDDRRRLALTYGRLAREVASQGIDAVCATISMFHVVREWNRHHIPRYREIYLRVPLPELERATRRASTPVRALEHDHTWWALTRRSKNRRSPIW